MKMHSWLDACYRSSQAVSLNPCHDTTSHTYIDEFEVTLNSWEIAQSRFQICDNMKPTFSFQEAMVMVKDSQRHNSSIFFATNYATNPRNYKAGSRSHSNVAGSLPPLENRNSAPEIVITGTSQQLLAQPHRRVGIEERLNRARQRVQNGLQSLSGSYSSQTLNHPSKSLYPKPKLSSRYGFVQYIFS